MFDAGAMATKLGLDLSEYTRGMLEATSIAQVFLQTVTTFLANPLLGLVDVAKQVAGAVVNAVASFGKLADDIGDKAAGLGVSPDFLSGWGGAFADAGSSVEGFGESLKFLNKNAGEAAAGGQAAAQAFASIGIGSDFLKAHLGDTEALMRRTVDGIAALPTAAERTNAAMALLGRGAGDALGAIAGGSRGLDDFAEVLRALGGIVTEEDAQMGDAFGKLSTIVSAAFLGIERAAARPILRALGSHFDDTKSGIIAASRGMQDAVEGAVSGMIPGLEALAGTVKDLGPGATSTAKAFGGDLANAFITVNTALKPLLAELELLDRLMKSIGFGGTGDFLRQTGLGFLGPLPQLGAEIDRIQGGPGKRAGAAVAEAATFGLSGITVNVMADPNVTADEIARKITPQIQAALVQQNQATSAATSQRIVGGL
jgi:hypothetical protein